MAKTNKQETTPAPTKTRFTIGTVVTAILTFSTLILGGVAGYYSLSALTTAKLHDVWAIQFLELEQRGHRMADYLQSLDMDAEDGKTPDVVLHIDSQTVLSKVKGDFPDTIKPSDLHLERPELYARWNVLSLSGVNYMAREMAGNKLSDLNIKNPQGVYLLLWKMDVPQKFIDQAGPLEETVGYLVTKEGRLLYTNDPSITEVNFSSRPLVQRFIQAPLGKGQMELTSAHGTDYGFFYEIPDTNLLLFGETPKSVTLGEVKTIATRFVLILIATLLALVVLINYPVNNLVTSIGELARLCRQIGAGNFHVQPTRAGFGEVGALTRNFNEMAKNLAKLYPDENEKNSKDKKIQTPDQEVLPPFHETSLPEEAGLEVAQFSMRTKPIGADWQTVWFDTAHQQTIACLVDVNGRDHAAAMVVGMIAAQFEEIKAHPDGFSLPFFAERVNTLMVQAHLKWLARVLVARFDRSTQEIELLNMGNPSPLLFNQVSDNIQTEIIELPSQTAGFSAEVEGCVKRVPFAPGNILAMFTNGAVKLSKNLESGSTEELPAFAVPTADQTMEDFAAQWKKGLEANIKRNTPPDDVCFMVARAK